MKVKLYFCLLLLIIQFSIVNGQANTADSLKRLLSKETVDVEKVNLILNLTRVYASSKPDTALLIAYQGITLAQKINYQIGEAKLLEVTGIIFSFTGNYPQSLKILLQAMQIAESLKNEELIAGISNGLSNVYDALGDLPKSIEYSNNSISRYQKLNDSYQLCSSLLNLGDTYEKANQIDSAINYTKKGYLLAQSINSTYHIGASRNNFGNIYQKTGKGDSAFFYYRASLIPLIQCDNRESICEAYLGIAKLYEKSVKTDSCLYYAKLSFSIAQASGFTDEVLNAVTFLANYYKTAHKVDSAYFYQSIIITSKDSLFSQQKENQIHNLSYNEIMRQQQIADAELKAKTQLKLNTLLGGMIALLIIAFVLYRANKHRKKAYRLLQKQKQETDLQKGKLEVTLDELKSTQKQLIQSEKMASLGELTAGIAHEIQNPLNFVNNFSEVNKELLQELKEEADKGNIDEIKLIANDVIENSEKINHHGKRADAIVKGMLQHTRASSGQKELTDINKLADEYLRLAYHGLRAKDKSFNAVLITNYDESVGSINIVAQDIARVLLNIYNNAFYAVNEKAKQSLVNYEPAITVTTKKIKDKVEISIRDNGNGIPQKVIDKIFQPFFTTKPTGQGTGLGLSLSYDIIKAHGGEIKVNTNDGEFTEFVITI